MKKQELSYTEYACYMHETGKAYCDIAGGTLHDNHTDEYQVSMDEIRLMREHINNDRDFYIAYSELCTDRYGDEHVKRWERQKRYIEANVADPDYVDELELLRLQGLILGPLRLLYGDEIADVREIVLAERDKFKLVDWIDAAVYCSSLVDFAEYISSPYCVKRTLHETKEALKAYMRFAYGDWEYLLEDEE